MRHHVVDATEGYVMRKVRGFTLIEMLLVRHDESMVGNNTLGTGTDASPCGIWTVSINDSFGADWLSDVSCRNALIHCRKPTP